MKRTLVLIVLAALCCALCLGGCTGGGSTASSSTSIQSSSSEISTSESTPTTPPDLSDLNGWYEYIRLPLWAGILSYSWDDPSEVRPSDYVDLFARYDEENGNRWNLQFPANELEKYVQNHFTVSIAYLRSADEYNADNNEYDCIGFGAGGTAAVTNVLQEENGVVAISFDVFSRANDTDVIWSGEVRIQFTDSGYQFVSNKIVTDYTSN